MYNKNDLKKDLASMGLVNTDALMVHSSMKAVGDVDGGADTVVDAFIEYFDKGLFMVPTHTWKQMSREYNIFDPQTEPSCVGIITNICLKKSDSVRSLHPTHSIAAFGNNAKQYVEGEENVNTPCSPDGCWGRLADINAKILLIGVTHARNTFIHAIEEMYDVPERFTEQPETFYIKMPDGTLKERKMYRHYNKKMVHISEAFDKMMEGYFETGAAQKVKFGDAESILCDCKKLVEVTDRILKKEINCFIDRDFIPCEWYK